ncbi:MAG: TetR/AcrR family transcriptional regulator [Oligoflexales bacterium]|nr:TetR/AcrR family transcriptional regulator [Oligoflexales bacterium]
MPTTKIHNIPPIKLKKIILSALREFSENEYDKASFNRIISSSGVSKGSMYYYFDSKEDLFSLIMKNCIKSLAESLQTESFITTPEHFWKDVVDLLDTVHRYFRNDPALGRFVKNVITYENISKNTPISITLHKVRDWLRGFLANGQDIGAVRKDLPIDLLVAMTWTSWQTAIDFLCQDKNINPFDKSSFTELILDGFYRLLTPSIREPFPSD